MKYNRNSTRSCLLGLMVVLALVICGCSKHTAAWERMDSAERMMEDKPEKALAILDSLSADSLGGEEAARYALLKSMALDKNYVDTTDFSVLQPAIDYYSEHGTATERLRTYYYQGRIYENMGDNEKAMKAYVLGRDLFEDSPDTLTAARLLVSQSIIFQSLYNFKAVIQNNLKAAQLYGLLGKGHLQAECFTNALGESLREENKQCSDSLMRLCEQEYKKGYLTLKELFPYKLTYLVKYGSAPNIRNLLNESGKLSDVSTECMMKIANGYHALGEYKMAVDILEQVKEAGVPYDSLMYYSIMAPALDSLHDYKNAINNYNIFFDKLTDENLTILDQKLQFSNERYRLELQAEKEKEAKVSILWWSVCGIIVLSMSVAMLLLYLRNNRIRKELAIQQEKATRLENEKLKNKVALLENEQARLTTLLETQRELPDEVQNAIKVRIDMLNAFFASQITANEQYEMPFEEWTRKLVENVGDFMNSNRLAFEASHPRFIQYFKEHGLTIDEINYVCLYAIGLRGKEVGVYMKKRSHVNTSSAIRKKLGIDKHETNLGIFVRRLLKQT